MACAIRWIRASGNGFESQTRFEIRMTGHVLDVRGLTVSLPPHADRAHAVSDVSFTVAPGEIVCLVGESGSGKSVIAHTIMGLLPKALAATAGEILVAGENVLAVSEARLRALR